MRGEVEKGYHVGKDSLTMAEWDARSAAFVEKSLEGKEGRQRELALKNLRKKEARLRMESIERRAIRREMEVANNRREKQGAKEKKEVEDDLEY